MNNSESFILERKGIELKELQLKMLTSSWGNSARFSVSSLCNKFFHGDPLRSHRVSRREILTQITSATQFLRATITVYLYPAATYRKN